MGDQCPAFTWLGSSQIKARHGKCLDASERNKNGGKVHMWDCNTLNPNQQWRYDAVTLQIKSSDGRCLDASERNKNGGKVHMWDCNTSSGTMTAAQVRSRRGMGSAWVHRRGTKTVEKCTFGTAIRATRISSGTYGVFDNLTMTQSLCDV